MLGPRSAKQQELEWRKVVVSVQIRVDAGAVRLEQASRFRIQLANDRLRLPVYPEGSEKTVGIQTGRADELGDPTLPDPAVEFDLPQPVLGMRIPEREQRIGLGLRRDR